MVLVSVSWAHRAKNLPASPLRCNPGVAPRRPPLVTGPDDLLENTNHLDKKSDAERRTFIKLEPRETP